MDDYEEVPTTEVGFLPTLPEFSSNVLRGIDIANLLAGDSATSTSHLLAGLLLVDTGDLRLKLGALAKPYADLLVNSVKRNRGSGLTTGSQKILDVAQRKAADGHRPVTSESLVVAELLQYQTTRLWRDAATQERLRELVLAMRAVAEA